MYLPHIIKFLHGRSLNHWTDLEFFRSKGKGTNPLDTVKKTSLKARKTALIALLKSSGHLKSEASFGRNSDHKAPEIDLQYIKVWEDFLANGEIERMINDEEVREVLNKDLSDDDTDILYAWGKPTRLGGCFDEKAFEIAWSRERALLNSIFYMCASEVQNTTNPKVIEIGVGSCAKHTSPERNDGTFKHPDLASYEIDPEIDQFTGDGPCSVWNRIPGDAKLFRKITHSMLSPDGEYWRANSVRNPEARKVLKQIHNYMDMHEARYGYIVTDEELIFFRRRESGWGHIDVSPPIRHDVNAIIEEKVGVVGYSISIGLLPETSHNATSHH